MEPRDYRFYDIKPLETIEEYQELSEEDLKTRYSMATANLMYLAGSLRKRKDTSVDFLLKEVVEYQRAGDYSQSFGDDHKRSEIRLARKAVEVDELCGTVLDRLISLCITKGSIENVKNKKLLKLLTQWESKVGNLEDTKDSANTKIYTTQAAGIPVVLEYILERLFVDGDSFVSSIWGEAVSIEDDTFILPYKIKVHDSLIVDYDEVEFEKTGREKVFLNMDLARKTVSFNLLKEKKIPLFGNSSVFTTHLKLRPKTFHFWGTSYFKRAFQPIAQRKRIEALEIETIEGLIHRLTIIKAGKIDADTEHGIIAPHRLAMLESILSQPKLNSLLLWPGDDLSIEEVGPKSEVLTYENKYKATNEQTLAALGVPRVLIDGLESSTENWQKFLGIISFLDKIRNNYILPWINSLLREIAVKNGFKNEYPKYSFSRLKLYDLKQLLDAVKLFYDRGLMSELSALVNGDLDFDIEYSRREYEKDFGIVNNFDGPKFLPFSKNTPDGSVKDSQNNPDKGISTDKETGKERETKASITDSYRQSLIDTFESYIFSIHDMYSKKIVEQVEDGNPEVIAAILFAYSEHLKRDIRDQMTTLFRQELAGQFIEPVYLEASVAWLFGFLDGYVEYLEKEITNILKNNISLNNVLVAGLISGFLESVKNKRLRLYSSSIYNKAVSAGEVTSFNLEGKENIRWICSLSDRSCAWCSSMHDKVLTSEKFLQEFPPHPYCECIYESTTDELSDNLPEKDPKNWSKPLQ